MPAASYSLSLRNRLFELVAGAYPTRAGADSPVSLGRPGSELSVPPTPPLHLPEFRVADHDGKAVARRNAGNGRRHRKNQGQKQGQADVHNFGNPAKNSADPSLRRGDLTLRKPHYQTGYASPVNRLQSKR